MSGAKIAPEHCPRFEQRSANVCPLDPNWKERVHLQSESVCGLLLESVKTGGEARLGAYVQGELIAEVLRQRMPISTRWGDIKRRLDRASQAGSKLEAAERMRNTLHAT